MLSQHLCLLFTHFPEPGPLPVSSPREGRMFYCLESRLEILKSLLLKTPGGGAE